jgi:hypothetical protein
MQGWDGPAVTVCEKVQTECEGGVEVSGKAVSVDVYLGLPSRTNVDAIWLDGMTNGWN